MATRNDFTKGMQKDLYGYFFDTYDKIPTVYDQIYDEQPSSAAWEQDTSVVGLGQLAEKAENDPIVYRAIQEGFSTYGDNHTFSDGFQVSMEAVEDNQKLLPNMVKSFAGLWGESVRNTRESFYAKTFNYGGYTAGHSHFGNPIAGQNADNLCYDGKPLFNLSNNTRTSKGGGTYYNGAALSLTQANVITQYKLMTQTNNRDERDEIVSIVPDILLVPPAEIFTARVILESTNLPGSTNNDVNVTANLMRPVMWHYLTDTNAWFLLASKKGLIAQNRKAPVIDFYIDEDNKAYKANIIARWGFRVKNWRFLVGSNFSTS